MSAFNRKSITAALVAAVILSTPALAQRESLSERIARLEQRLNEDVESRQTLTDMVYQLSQLQAEIRELRGLIEDQRFEIENLRSSQQDQYLDLDRRLAQLEQGGTRPVAGSLPQATSNQTDPGRYETTPEGGFGPAPVADPVREDAATTTAGTEFPEVREPIDAGIETAGLGRNPSEPVATIADPVAEKNAYDAAFDALKSGRYAEASRLFGRFVEEYPNSEYADNAQYWLGESYYVTRNYRVALDAFQKLIGRFPNSAKAPDARLKIGLSYYSLQNWSAAETELKAVIEQYPDTTVARLAENRLRTMRIEGYIQ